MSRQGHTTAAAACPPAWRAPLIVVVLGLLWFLLLPDYLGLLTRMAFVSLLVISLDLVVGIAGLGTLGHAAMFGAGAYAAGIAALRLHPDPTLGLLIGITAGAVVAVVSGAFLLRYQGMTFLMLTVAVLQVLQSLANKFRDWTGGDDGLTGFSASAMLGWFRFDMKGQTAALYALSVLGIGYYIARRVVDSPFGLSVRGIRENRARMTALGSPVFARLLAMYAISGAMAGAAGAVSAQANGVVGLDSLGFNFSAECLVMLILGGAGRQNGAIIGVVVYALIHHTASSMNPYHWLFVIGVALMAVVFFSPQQMWKLMRSRLPGMRVEER